MSGSSQKPMANSQQPIAKGASHSYHDPRYNGCSPETKLACPYFVPLEIVNDGSWLHPARLPLGAGWTGNCCASEKHVAASETHTREFCNLGYATDCPHLPAHRDWDAIRFSVDRTSRTQLTICFVCELGHAPIAHGKLTFDLASEAWLNAHPDARVLRLATCFVQAHRARQPALCA